MLRHVRLNEDDRDLRVDPRSEIEAREFARLARERLRVLGQGDRVQVDDAEEALVLVLQRGPVAQRAEIVADVYVAGRLRAAEDAFHLTFMKLRERLAATPAE